MPHIILCRLLLWLKTNIWKWNKSLFHYHMNIQRFVFLLFLSFGGISSRRIYVILFISGKFCTRCFLFCGLWVGSFYTYVYSLQILHCTELMALYSVHIAFVYLLAWVVLHEQFVGVRVRCFLQLNFTKSVLQSCLNIYTL